MISGGGDRLPLPGQQSSELAQGLRLAAGVLHAAGSRQRTPLKQPGRVEPAQRGQIQTGGVVGVYVIGGVLRAAGQGEVAQVVAQGGAVAAHLIIHAAQIGQVGGNALLGAVALLQSQSLDILGYGFLIVALAGVSFADIIDGAGHTLPVAELLAQAAAGFKIGNAVVEVAAHRVQNAAQDVGLGLAWLIIQALPQLQCLGGKGKGAGGVAVAVFPNQLVEGFKADGVGPQLPTQHHFQRITARVARSRLTGRRPDGEQQQNKSKSKSHSREVAGSGPGSVVVGKLRLLGLIARNVSFGASVPVRSLPEAAAHSRTNLASLTFGCSPRCYS